MHTAGMITALLQGGHFNWALSWDIINATWADVQGNDILPYQSGLGQTVASNF